MPKQGLSVSNLVKEIVFPRGFQLETWLDIYTLIFSNIQTDPNISQHFVQRGEGFAFKNITDTFLPIYAPNFYLFVREMRNRFEGQQYLCPNGSLCKAARDVGVQKSLHGYSSLFLFFKPIATIFVLQLNKKDTFGEQLLATLPNKAYLYTEVLHALYKSSLKNGLILQNCAFSQTFTPTCQHFYTDISIIDHD